MKGIDNRKVTFFLLLVLFLVSAYLLADYIECDGPFPDDCPIGGCNNPISAEDCGLFFCEEYGPVIKLCSRAWPI